MRDTTMGERLDLIAFDADDTLWHNERSYRDARDRFGRLLAAAGVHLDDAVIEARIHEIEVANLPYYGYGVSSFALSLMETAIELTGGAIPSAHLRDIIALAKEMLSEQVELFPNVRHVLTKLAGTCPLMLITKGDLLHQTAKVDRSGLRDCFQFVEVVSDKTTAVYAAILARQGIEPRRFLMVGNSLRSDILPIVELGGWAVHVPAALSWAHEHVDVTEEIRRHYFEIASLDQLPPVVDTLTRAVVG